MKGDQMDGDEINASGLFLLVTEIIIGAARDLCGRAPVEAKESALEFLGAAGLAERAPLICERALSSGDRRRLMGIYFTDWNSRGPRAA